MAENKDLYKLGQSVEGSIVDKGQEIRIDLQLEDNILSDVGTVFGKVVDVDSNPIVGATIKITDTSYNPKYHVITDNEGQYTIDNIEAGKQYFVLSIKDKYNLRQGLSFIMQKSQQIERNFVLIEDNGESSSLVAGDIEDKESNKLEGVVVKLYDNSGSEPQLLKTTHTNQFGQYAFFDVKKSVYLLSASLLGYSTAETTFVISEDRQVMNINLTVLDDPVSRQGTINGIIKDKEGLPIEEAFVVLFKVTENEEGKEVLTPIRKTITNDEGLYLFEQIPEGDYKIKANKLGE